MGEGEDHIQGDVDAFGALVARYQRPLFWGIYHRVRNREDARELTQQVFLKIFQNLASFDPSRSFFSWAYRIAMNETTNFLQARKPADSLEDGEPPSSGSDPAQDLEMDERSRDLHRAVRSLDPKYREPVVLCHFLQLSYEEAAQAMDLPLNTLKSRLFAARAQLRDLLKAKGHVP